MVDWCSSVEHAWLGSLSHFYLVCRNHRHLHYQHHARTWWHYPIIAIPVSELSWKSLNVSSNSSYPDNDNTAVSKVSWWWCVAALRLLPQSLLSQITTFWNHDHSQDQDHHFGFNFDVFKISNGNFFSKQTAILARSKTWISRMFFSNFCKSDFSIFACSQIRIRKLDI